MKSCRQEPNLSQFCTRTISRKSQQGISCIIYTYRMASKIPRWGNKNPNDLVVLKVKQNLNVNVKFNVKVTDILWQGSRLSHAIELTLFLWHMPDEATEGVAENSSRLQPSINLHAQLEPLCSAALVPNVLPRRDEGSGKPCAVIEAL